ARTMRESGEGGDVDDPQQGVGWRLDPDDLRRGANEPLDGRDIAHVAGVELQSPRTVHLAQELEGAVVRVLRRDDVVAWGEHLEHDAGGGESGGEGDGAGPPFELGERALE